MDDNTESLCLCLCLQAEGCIRGILTYQSRIEDLPAGSAAASGPLPLAVAVELVAGEAGAAELAAYAADAARALEALADLGHSSAAVVLWDVFRCNPALARTTVASLLSANLTASLRLVAECLPRRAAA